MVTPQLLRIAKELEEFGRHKVRLAEVVLERPLTDGIRDKLYAAAIRDQFGLIFQLRPEIRFNELYNALQMEEMHSDENVYYATQKLGRPPTEEEIEQHYLDSDRPSKFNSLFKELESELA